MPKYAIDEFMKSVYDVGVRSQGTEMGVARNSKTRDRANNARRGLIDRLMAKQSQINYINNKDKGSKGGMR